MWLLVALGCRSVHVVSSTEFEREITQSALVQAAAPPHAHGPLAPAGRTTIDGRLLGGPATLPTAARAEGAPGASIATDFGGIRVAYGAVEWLEVGFRAELGIADGAVPLATDLEGEGYTGIVARAGPDLRARGIVAGGLFGGLSIDGDVLPIAYIQRVNWSAEERPSGDEETDQDEWLHQFFYLSVRPGAEAGFTSPEGFELALRAYVQNLPEFFGSDTDTWTCVHYSDGTDSCRGEHSVPQDYEEKLASGAGLAVAVPISEGRGSLRLAIDHHWGHDSADAAPFTGALSFSWVLGPDS